MKKKKEVTSLAVLTLRSKESRLNVWPVMPISGSGETCAPSKVE